jgi:hypothetical protein
MRNRLQCLAPRAVLIVLLSGGAFVFWSASAMAQDQQQPPSPLAGIVKEVMLDPTTYAPAVIAYDATMRDWNTSQPFFRNGFMELNPHFTVSGMPNGEPLSYADGKRRILSDAFATLGVSAINNFTDRIFERKLRERFPNHRKIVGAVSWIERLSFGGYLSYALSAAHYRQAQANQSLARQLGYQ